MNNEKLANKLKPIFFVLSSETRLKIILCLKERALNVQEIEQEIGASQSLISHQLAILRKHNLVSLNQIGKTKVYTLSDDHVRHLVDTTIAHICE